MKQLIIRIIRKIYYKLIVPLKGFYYRRTTKYTHKGKIALCCIAKMENDYIRFFVEYYKRLHFDKIIIYDNNELNGERFEEVIDDYIQSGFVDIINFRGKEAPQLEAYQNCYERFNKEYDWIAFFDCDEFLTFADGTNDIHSFLSQKKYHPFQIVQLNWMIYGDNELLDNDGRNIIERFKNPIIPYDFKTNYLYFPENSHVKSILRGGMHHIVWECAHNPQTEYYYCCTPKGGGVKVSYKQEIDYSIIYLRHYSTKTIGEWVRNKMIKGDVFYKGEIVHEIKSLDFFFRYNKKTEEKIKYAETLMKSYSETIS